MYTVHRYPTSVAPGATGCRNATAASAMDVPLWCDAARLGNSSELKLPCAPLFLQVNAQHLRPDLAGPFAGPCLYLANRQPGLLPVAPANSWHPINTVT